ncbi:MAG TPA: 1-acyl-sn-glycerol-3-phosphate acyltransferase [Kofleriaceae bacterium]|nr:1-acyl-sn-glycerol-3-phosphate acyltransferase [Kofleriaceae bacterium]
MSDVRRYNAERASIADAVLHRVGGNRADVTAIVDEIAGTFSSPLYGATIALLPHLLGAGFGGTFADRVEVTGDLAALRELSTRATIILAPTHSSNLDSIVLGVVTARAGLPPFAYASGRHIYRHRVFAQLMRRLGAYKLDPDRRDRLYLRIVNVYVNELLARGYHSMIFPTGTRCRSGEVESKVKLGLLGAAVHAPGPIAIVPVTINYQIVLEADHLIAYHLAGRSHERIVGDELFVRGRLLASAKRFATLDQRVAIRFDEPIDPHAVQPWRSHLAAMLTAAYRCGTVFFPTHIVARALLDATDATDATATIALEDAHRAIAKTCSLLARSSALGTLWRATTSLSDAGVLDAALRAWASWHPSPPIARVDDRIAITNRDLLLFYTNRTAHVSPPASR